MSELSKYISNLKGEILQWRIEERHSPGTVQVLDAGEWYVADLKALTARVEELEQENAKLLDEVTERRFTDECTDKLLDELEAKNKRLREALDTIHKRIMGYEPDNRIEARFFGELKIIARKALDSKAE